MGRKAEHEAIYRAARLWAQRCLVDDLSVFDDQPIWTQAHVEELERHYVENLDESKRDFMTKLEDQLSPVSPGAKRLTAELFWAMYLFTASLKAPTKSIKIRRVWDWSGMPFPEESPLLQIEVLHGIGGTGPGFQNYFWLELSYAIDCILAIKKKEMAERERLLSDPWAWAEFLDGCDPTRSRQLRHIFAHILFPDEFESISSRGNKKAILLALADAEERAALDFKDRQSMDRVLLAMRRRLEKDHGMEYDYYSDQSLAVVWQPKAEDDSEDGTSTDVLRKASAREKAAASLPDRYAGARFWCIGAGHGAKYWDIFKSRNAIAVGFEEFGEELPGLDSQAIFDRLAAARSDGRKPWNDALAAEEFSRSMRKGDYVFVKKGRSILLGLGKVASDYRFDPAFPLYHHVRDVQWLKTGEWQMEESQQITTKTLTEFTKYRDWLAYALALIGMVEAPKAPEAVAEDAAPYGIAEEAVAFDMAKAIEGAFIDEPTMSDFKRAWEAKKNLILKGSPGTGKSWIARKLAYLLLGAEDDSRLLALQFHQSYSYEDFVRGWRPGKNQFELVDGPFMLFCERARLDPGRPYVALIDEINRGNVSRIFGELFSLIEADKRKKKYAVRLSCPREGEKPFFVPDNVYVLGTMNSADRSLAVVDYALRRRFCFRTLEPAYGRDEFDDFLTENLKVDPAIVARIDDSMGKLNAAIAADRNLGVDYQIGHSYFSSSDDENSGDARWYESIIRGEIIPLLEEYWFDEPDKAREWKEKLTR